MERFLIKLPKLNKNKPQSNDNDGPSEPHYGSFATASSSRESCDDQTNELVSDSDSNPNHSNDFSYTTTATANLSESEVETVESEQNEASANEATPQEIKKRRRLYKGKDKRKFNVAWSHNFPWLIEKNGDCFCKYCNRSMTRNHAHLQRHERTQFHKNKVNGGKYNVDVAKFLCNKNDKELLAREVKKAEYNIVMALVEHNLPFLLMDHLPQLLKKAAPDSEILKEISCARSKAKAMVDVMGTESTNIIKKDLIQRKFSLIIDETTDLSTTKCLAVLARYVDLQSQVVRDRLLSLVKVESSTAVGLTSAITDLLKCLKIPFSNVIGFAADNTNTMMGDYNGVQIKLRELVNKDIFVMGCICHSMALCASYAANKLPKGIEGFVRNIYNYFRTSSKRLDDYKNFQHFADIKPHKLLRLSQTRWLSLEAVVSRVLEQWPALLLYFQLAAVEDNLGSTDEILFGLQNSIFKLYMTFLSYILPIITKLNIEFQSEHPKLYAVHERISCLFKTVLKNYLRKEFVDNCPVIFKINTMDVRQYLSNDDIYLGEETAILLLTINLPKSEIIQFKNNCLAYYIELATQIKTRFRNLDEYQEFSLLNPKKLLTENIVLAPILNKYRHLTNNNVQEIASECREMSNLPEKLKDELLKLNFEKCWFELYEIKNGENERVFENICHFAFNICSLPHSSAAAERTFSQLNLIKSKTRNHLNPETCNSLLLAKELLNGKPCYFWEADNSIIKNKLNY